MKKFDTLNVTFIYGFSLLWIGTMLAISMIVDLFKRGLSTETIEEILICLPLFIFIAYMGIKFIILSSEE